MRSGSRTPRNNRGQWAPDSVDQVSTNDAGQYLAPKPQKNQPLKFWQIFNVEATTQRSGHGVTLLSWAIYILYIMGTIFFWLAVLIFLKTLFFWEFTGNAVGTTLCWIFRDCTIHSVSQSLFPVAERDLSYNLLVLLDGPSANVKIVDQTLRFSNPIQWTMIAFSMYAFNKAMHSIFLALVAYRGTRAIGYP